MSNSDFGLQRQLLFEWFYSLELKFACSLFNANSKKSGLKTRSFENGSTEEVLSLWWTRTAINKIQI